MTQWNKKVKFRDLLEEYNVDAEDELIEIERIKPLWITRFESIPSLKHFVPALKNIKTESGFNKWLNKIFDYCDENKIWVEL
jgi:hypothetical protein